MTDFIEAALIVGLIVPGRMRRSSGSVPECPSSLVAITLGVAPAMTESIAQGMCEVTHRAGLQDRCTSPSPSAVGSVRRRCLPAQRHANRQGGPIRPYAPWGRRERDTVFPRSAQRESRRPLSGSMVRCSPSATRIADVRAASTLHTRAETRPFAAAQARPSRQNRQTSPGGMPVRLQTRPRHRT